MSIFTLILLLTLTVNRLYQPIDFIYPFDLIKRIIPASFHALLFLSTLIFLTKDFIKITINPWHIFPLLFFAISILFIFRLFVFFIMKTNRERILLMGISEQAREFIKESEIKRFRGYEIVGITTGMDAQLKRSIMNIPILGHIDTLESIITKNIIDTIVLTLRDRRKKFPTDSLLHCKFKNIRIIEGATFYETIKQKIMIDNFLKPSWFILEEGFHYTSLHEFMKRAQGLSVSMLLLLLFSPLLIITALLIKMESKGPVFYIQERIGHNGKPFNLIKFRSMTESAEKKSGPQFAIKGDMRVTRVGKIIRKIRIDEAPQLINIFKGDMDLVGPRPERDVFVKELENLVPYYALRHSVRPGLTGWAQVNYPYGENFEDSKEKLKYDLYYIKHYSNFLDLKIIFMTVREILFAKGH